MRTSVEGRTVRGRVAIISEVPVTRALFVRSLGSCPVRLFAQVASPPFRTARGAAAWQPTS